MSMTDEERATLVTLELKKAHETFEEIGILTAANMKHPLIPQNENSVQSQSSSNYL